MLAMPVDQHKKKFIQVKNTIKIEYYYLYLIQELLVAMHVLKKDVTVNCNLAILSGHWAFGRTEYCRRLLS